MESQNMTQRSVPRKWIWAALAVQVIGLAFDAVWHGLNPDFEATTVTQMVRHLSTVHLPIYAGVLSVFISTAWALVDKMKQSKIGIAPPVAFAGALVSMAGEIWHAYTHLQLSTHSGPIAGMTAVLGLIVVVAALWLEGRHDGRAPADDVYSRAGPERSISRPGIQDPLLISRFAKGKLDCRFRGNGTRLWLLLRNF